MTRTHSAPGLTFEIRTTAKINKAVLVLVNGRRKNMIELLFRKTFTKKVKSGRDRNRTEK